MKETEVCIEIKNILREQKASQIEYYNYINDNLIPKAATSIVFKIYKLIRDGSDLKVALSPSIVLDYEDMRVYYRILPLTAAPLFETDIERSRYFKSSYISELLKIKKYEVYADYARRALCKSLSKAIKESLKSDGFKKIKIEEKLESEWSTQKKNIYITFS